MKILKIALLSLAALLIVLVVGLVIFIKTFDLNRFLPEITKNASQALGRALTIERGDLNAGLSGVVLDLKGLRLADIDPAAPPALTVEDAHARLELMPFVFRREIQISSIVFSKVKVAVADPKTPVNILVPTVRAQVSGFSLKDPFTVNMDARVASKVENIRMSTHVQLDTEKSVTTLVNLMLTSDVSQLDLNEVKTITPALAEAPLPTSIAGQLQVEVPKAQIGPKGLEALQANIRISEGSIKMKELPVPLTGVQAKAEADTNAFNVTQLSANLGQGTVNAQARITDYLKALPQLSAKATFGNLNIEELADVKAMPVVVKGKVNGNAAITAQGFDPNVLLPSLKGNGEVTIAEGSIEQFKLFQAMLGPTLGRIPGLSQAIDGILNNVLQKHVGSNTIALDKAQAQFTIADSAVNLDNALLGSKTFDLEAKGKVGFDMNASIATTLRLSSELSAKLVEDTKPLSYLQDETGRLKIDGQTEGVLPNVKFNPSFTFKEAAKSAIVEEGSKQLQKVIEKNPEVGNILNAILGGGNEGQQQQNAAGTNSEEDPNAKTKQQLNGLLNNIFK